MPDKKKCSTGITLLLVTLSQRPQVATRNTNKPTIRMSSTLHFLALPLPRKQNFTSNYLLLQPHMENSISPPFLHKAILSSTYKSSQAETNLGASSENLPFPLLPLLSIHLIKICLEISLRFPLDVYLGKPKNSNTGNNLMPSILGKNLTPMVLVLPNPQ